MQFAETKLPQNPLIQEAFEYSQQHIMTKVVPETIRDFTDQIKAQFEQKKAMLEMALESEEITQEQFQKDMSTLNKNHANLTKAIPFAAKKKTEDMFRTIDVACAQELAQVNSVTPEAIAAALLLNQVRSPVDSKNIAKQFGDGVADLISEIVHIKSYPMERSAKIAACSEEAKRIFMGGMIVEFMQMKKDLIALKKEMGSEEITFTSTKEKDIHAEIVLLAPADITLAKKLTAVFNEAAKEMRSPYHIEIGDNNDIYLVETKAPRINDPSRILPPGTKDKKPDSSDPSDPKPPAPPKGPNRGWGDNVF